MTPMLGIMASQISGHLSTTAYDSIATVTLSSGQASIEFTSIPSTYKHLQIRAIAKNVTTGAADYDAIRMTVNSDTGSNYTWHSIESQAASNLVASAAASYPTAFYRSGGIMRSGTGQTNAFTGAIIDILDYQNTSKYKTFRGMSGTEYAGTYAYLLFTSGMWQSTSAITSIKFVVDTAANFAQYSSFALYGIKW